MNNSNSQRLDDRHESGPLKQKKLPRHLLGVLAILVGAAFVAGLVAMRFQAPPQVSKEQAAAAVNTEPSSARNVEDLLPPSLAETLAKKSGSTLPPGATPMPKFSDTATPTPAQPAGGEQLPKPDPIKFGAPLGNGAVTPPAPVGRDNAKQMAESAHSSESNGVTTGNSIHDDSLLVFAFTDRDSKSVPAKTSTGNSIIDLLQSEMGKGAPPQLAVPGGVSAADIASIVAKLAPPNQANSRALDPGKAQADFNAKLASEKIADAPLAAVTQGSGQLPRIWQGSLIPAVMKTSIDTEQSGKVVAQVTRDIFDSQTQRIKLIPKGSELVGQYSSSFVDGQNRVLLSFTRLTLPDGRRVNLGAMSGADSIGRTGVAADVDNRFGRRFTAAALTAVLGVAADRLASRNQPNTTTINVGATAGSATSQAIGEASRSFLGREMSIGAVGRVEAGAELRVMVDRDIELGPWSAP